VKTPSTWVQILL